MTEAMTRKLKRVWSDECAAQIVEFAVSLPLLVVFVVGIFDFSNANYLISEKINDCGLAGAGAPTVAGLTWTYTANGGGCPGTGITLLINRGCDNIITTNAGTLNLIGTCVTITYPYKWEFNNVASSLGWTGSGPSTIVVKAGALNEN